MTKTVLDEIKHALMAANAVDGEQEFCVAWLGKNASYMRVLRFQQLQPSADALAVCASKLNYYTQRLERSSDRKHKQWAQGLAVLHLLCSATQQMHNGTKRTSADKMASSRTNGRCVKWVLHVEKTCSGFW